MQRERIGEFYGSNYLHQEKKYQTPQVRIIGAAHENRESHKATFMLLLGYKSDVVNETNRPSFIFRVNQIKRDKTPITIGSFKAQVSNLTQTIPDPN